MAYVKLKHGQSGTLKIGETIEVSEEEAKALVACGTFEEVTASVEAVLATKEAEEITKKSKAKKEEI